MSLPNSLALIESLPSGIYIVQNAQNPNRDWAVISNSNGNHAMNSGADIGDNVRNKMTRLHNKTYTLRNRRGAAETPAQEAARQLAALKNERTKLVNQFLDGAITEATFERAMVDLAAEGLDGVGENDTDEFTVATGLYGTKRKRGPQLNKVSGKCDECRSRTTDVACEYGPDDPRCAKCIDGHRSCCWNGLTRKGVRPSRPLTRKSSRRAAKARSVSRRVVDPSQITSVGSTSAQAVQGRKASVNSGGGTALQETREELSRLRAQQRLLKRYTAALEEYEQDLI